MYSSPVTILDSEDDCNSSSSQAVVLVVDSVSEMIDIIMR